MQTIGGEPVETLQQTSPLAATATRARRVLIVDDDRQTLATLQAVLEGAGFEVVCRNDLASAGQAFETHRFDLVLTDLYLGEHDLGYDVAEQARKQRPEVPVVLLTGRPSFGSACEALGRCIRDIIVKPVDPEILLAACRRTIEAVDVERRARLLEAQNRILALVAPRMIEAKDPTTSGHAERVYGYVARLAERCGVDGDDLESLRIAALLHDVGKIGVPREILCKEGPLTADERTIIQRHPGLGYEMLAGLDGCEDARLWVYQHHERWDGRGYPNQLPGDEVALPGRMLVLAEVYDALAEARSYKPAWPVPKIIAFFREEAGRHFDPDLAHMVADGLERHGKAYFAPRPHLLF